MIHLTLLVVAVCGYTCANALSDSFSEELLIKPLYSNQVYTHFHFSTKWDADLDTETFRHTRLFPRAVGEIVQRHNVQEFHLSLTAGLWRHESWGYPVVNAAPGAELWAWFKPNTKDVDQNWKDLASSLSGLICASLNFINGQNSISPKYSLRPTGVVKEQFINVNSSFLRYSSLPREIVCTENLTPWKKLLPCGSRKGIASLLTSRNIYSTRYHSLALHFRPVCKDAECGYTALEVQLSLGLVFDFQNNDWSMLRIFGHGVFGPCPLAKSSTIYIDTSINSSIPFNLSPKPDEVIKSFRGGTESTFAKYELTGTPLNIVADPIGKHLLLLNYPPPLHANQYLTGYGQEQGGIVTKVYNNYWNTLDIVVLQNIPWYVPIYLHTLKIQANGRDLKPLRQKYIPGKLRKRPYYLELALRLPPKSTTSISVEFEHVFLKWTEYPPDANHGFYIGSAIISSHLPLARNFTGLPQDGLMISDSFNASRSGYLVQMRTEVMVITLPTPDFSMPYNVICLACTVVALAFGPLHNITTKRLILKPQNKEKFVVKLKNNLLKFFKRENSDEKEAKEEDKSDK